FPKSTVHVYFHSYRPGIGILTGEISPSRQIGDGSIYYAIVNETGSTLMEIRLDNTTNDNFKATSFTTITNVIPDEGLFHYVHYAVSPGTQVSWYIQQYISEVYQSRRLIMQLIGTDEW